MNLIALLYYQSKVYEELLTKLTFLFVLQDMDTSNPAVFVNAELLRLYVGRRVRALIQVVRTEGGTVIGKSTDENQLVVKGSPPFPLTKFVEVIGIADGEKSIHADIWNNFGETIGMPSPPTLFQFLPNSGSQ